LSLVQCKHYEGKKMLHSQLPLIVLVSKAVSVSFRCCLDCLDEGRCRKEENFLQPLRFPQ
jgi:hypothetical protein